jgi:hypothetical protein
MPTPGNDIDILRQHIEDLFIAHAQIHALEEKALILAREGAERNLQRALDAMEKRLEGMNEFRSSLSDITSNAVSRDEYNTAHHALDEKYDSRVRSLERMIYMATGGVLLAGMVVNLVLYFVTKKG